MKLEDLQKQYSGTESLRGMVLCRPYRICGNMPGTPIHRDMIPISPEDDVREDDIVCAVQPSGATDIYRDEIATIVSFDSSPCGRPIILRNPARLEFYSDADVRRGCPDFSLCHRRQTFATIGGEKMQSVEAWKKWYNAIIPPDQREWQPDPASKQL